MALSTKAELRASLKAWSKRNELTDAELDDFILLAETELNRVLRVPAMEQRDQAFSITGEYTALPDGFREMRSILITDSPRHPLKLISPQAADEYYDSSDTGTPTQYMISGDAGVLSLRAIPSPSGTFTADILYFKAFDAIDDDSTNWLFDNHPDVYLWGGLLQMMPFIGDDERGATWQAKYAAAVRAVIEEGQRSRWSGSQPMMRVRNTP